MKNELTLYLRVIIFWVVIMVGNLITIWALTIQHDGTLAFLTSIPTFVCAMGVLLEALNGSTNDMLEYVPLRLAFGSLIIACASMLPYYLHGTLLDIIYPWNAAFQFISWIGFSGGIITGFIGAYMLLYEFRNARINRNAEEE
jgi:hypothetical protein